MYSIGDWRKRNTKMMDPRQYSFDYYTDASQKMEIKHSFGDEFLNNLHLLQDPLKKNLADTIVTNEDNNKKTKHKPDKNFLNMIVEPETPKMENTSNRSDFPPMPSFAGITSFFSGVLNVITGAVSQWRPKSPAQYYDCFDDSNVGNQGSPPVWQPSKDEDQNKSVWADQSSDAELYLENMDKDCKVAIANCENKLNKVRMLLDTKPRTPTFRSRRPRKVFVEPGSIEESFEDACNPEDFVSVSNTTYIKYSAPCQYQKPELVQTATPKTQIKTSPILETTEIVKALPELVQSNIDLKSSNISPDNTVNIELETVPLEKPIDTKEIINTGGDVDKVLVSTCEDKVTKLKALLQERRKKNTKSLPSTDSAPEPVEQNDRTKKPSKMVMIEQPKDKRFKNPCRTTDKRKKSKLQKSIQDDLLFAQEIISSPENSPSTLTLIRFSDPCPINEHSSPNDTQGVDYFDEVSGRFNSSYTDSEDSFQIVFNDSPKAARKRQPSDCDSEDSFIVFEDSPDSCYTSNDVFGDEDSVEETDTDCSDSESELSDSGCGSIAKMSHTLSRTIGDLTDDSLYDEQALDEVDCAVITGEEIRSEDLEVSEKVCDEVKSTGLLIDAAKKLQRKNQPPKKVHFSSDPPKVHVMRVWTFAARQARAGHWERCAIDRERFKRRIADVDMAVSWVLKPQHRSRVMFQRFMPWWNAQKRKELAEKKAREAEELVRKEEEKKLEEERIAKEEEEKKIEEDRIRKEEEKQIEEEKLKIESVSKVSLNKTDGIKNGEEHTESKVTKICNGNLIHGKINMKNNKNPKNKFEIKCKSVVAKNKITKNNLDIENKQIIPVNDKIDVKLEYMSAT